MIVKGFILFSCCYSLIPLFSSERAFKTVKLGEIGLKVNLVVYGELVAESKFLL